MKGYKLFIFIVIALLPVLILRDYTPDNELRYLSIVDEAMETAPSLPSIIREKSMQTSRLFTSGSSCSANICWADTICGSFHSSR